MAEKEPKIHRRKLNGLMAVIAGCGDMAGVSYDEGFQKDL